MPNLSFTKALFSQLKCLSFLIFFSFSSFATCLNKDHVLSKNTPLKSSPNCSFVFGVDNARPFQYKDYTGKAAGMQVDLVREIFKLLNCDLKFSYGSWDQLVNKLKAGEIDFLPDITPTKERDSYGYYSVPYRKELFTLYVRKNNYDEYLDKSFQQLLEEKFRVGLTSGYIYGKQIDSYIQNKPFSTNFHFSESNIANYQLILDLKIDGFLEDSIVAGYYLRRFKLGHVIKSLPVRFVNNEVVFMFNKHSVPQSFVNRFNRSLLRVKQSEKFRNHLLFDE